MNLLGNIAFVLVPAEALGAMCALLLVAGGMCLIVGAQRAGRSLIGLGIALPFVTVLAEILFNELFAVLPLWLVRLISWALLLLMYGLLFGAAMGALFGQRSWDEAKGHLIADSMRGIFRMAVSPPALAGWAVLGLYVWLRG